MLGSPYMFCGPLSGPRPASESNSGLRKRVNITLLFVTLNSGELVWVPMDAAAETFITFLCNDINFLGNNRQQRSKRLFVLPKSDSNILGNEQCSLAEHCLLTLLAGRGLRFEASRPSL